RRESTVESERLSRRSDVEAEQQHVAIAHNIIAALDAVMARFPRMAHAAGFHQIIKVDRFRLDEPTLEIGVDRARRLNGGLTPVHCPGAHFLFIEGKEGP